VHISITRAESGLAVPEVRHPPFARTSAMKSIRMPVKTLLLGAITIVLQGYTLAQLRRGAGPNHHGHPVEAAPATGQTSQTAPAQRRRQVREWTRYPLIEPAMRSGERDRRSIALTTRNADAAALEIFAPDQSVAGARRQVTLSPQGVTVSMLPGIGNYLLDSGA
jgi:hypothetical protein